MARSRHSTGPPVSLYYKRLRAHELRRNRKPSMSIIILIPTVICIVVLLRGSVEKAFLNVYIPIFMLFPTYYFWKVAMLPPIEVSEAVLLPLGIGIVATRIKRWRFGWTDLCMAAFLFTSGFADYQPDKTTAATFDYFACLMQTVVPYMAGKLLIEQEQLRIATARRFVICLFLTCIISGYEYRMGTNPFTLIWQRFFPGEDFDWKTQIRWGWGRVSGPYAQSELAGIILIFGLVLALWLAYTRHWEPKFSRAPWLPFRKSTIIVSLIALTLLMTQARGPWLGAVLAVPIAIVGRAKNVRRASILLAIFATIFLGGSYIALKQYANVTNPTTDEQQTAQYRTQLLDNYIPIAQKGGAWGWGQNFPRAIGQDSIDNEYLFIALTQGTVGLAAFCLLAIGAITRLLLVIVNSQSKEDCYFAFSLLGIFAGILFTIFTVYLGNQPYQLFFLLVGWSQSLVIPEKKTAPQPQFRQVFT